ncbi:MAG: TrmH family RNA methyltransferase, partial [Acidimicrobiia bacterium]
AHAETQVPQGLVATARPIPTATVDELVAEHAPAALLVLDHLLDPHNVGAIARSALAGGVPRLVVSGRRAAPLGATAFKAAAGALEHVRVAVAGSTAQVITRLEELGVWTVGLSANADQSLFGLSLLAEPVALVVGGEGAGLSRLVAERVDLTVRIPMTSGSESLNASAAAVLAVFEVTRVRSGPPTQTLSRP